MSKKNSASTPAGAVTVVTPAAPEVVVTGLASAMYAGKQQRRHDDRLQDADVVALRDVAPPLRVQAERGEDDRRADDDGRKRRREEIAKARRNPRGAVEAQPVGEPVRERDQCPVDRDLGKRMAVQGKGRGADPSAHRARLYGRAPGTGLSGASGHGGAAERIASARP